jgi:hypothetical protein
MTLCTQCSAQIPTLDRRQRRVNSELHQLGLTYHKFLPVASVVVEYAVLTAINLAGLLWLFYRMAKRKLGY